MSDWIILRPAPCETLNLAASLTEAGYEAWSPAERLLDREGEGRSRRRTIVPMIPGWVFAKADRLSDLLSLSHAPSMLYRVWDAELGRHVVKGHPFFRLLKDGGHIASVPDRALTHLRLEEQRGPPKQEVRRFAVGDKVSLSEAGHEGLVGTVLKSKNGKVKVQFSAAYSIEVEAWVLLPVDNGMEKAA